MIFPSREMRFMRRKWTKQISRIRLIVVGITFLGCLTFTSFMGTAALKDALKTKADLTYVKGKVNSITFIKHLEDTKFERKLKDVLVLTIEGSSERFGLFQFTAPFQKLLSTRLTGKEVALYYEPTGARIEHGVTLHIYDLKVRDVLVIDIAEKQRIKGLWAAFFFALTIIFAILTYYGLKLRKKKSTLPIHRPFKLPDDIRNLA